MVSQPSCPLGGLQHSQPFISGVNLREIGQEIQELLGGMTNVEQ